jgi:hypothetical protein
MVDPREEEILATQGRADGAREEASGATDPGSGVRRVEKAPGGAEFVEGLEVMMSAPMRLLEPLFTRLYAPRISTKLHALKLLLEQEP